MNCTIVTPASAGSTTGNRITAQRWADIIGGLGYEVKICEKFNSQDPAEVLIALHARKSFPSIQKFAKQFPGRPILLCMTGTDLYQDFQHSDRVKKSLQWATKIITLQDQAINDLPRSLHHKVEVIYQSSPTPKTAPAALKRVFEVTVIGHLRSVKDPFITAKAAIHLPAESRIRVTQIGKALSASMATRAEKEQQRNPRYQWLGELSPTKTHNRIARSHLMVVSSKLEGGANVIAEAVVRGVPVLATKIAGNIGMLGRSYPGYFPVKDKAALTKLLVKAETDEKFYSQLKSSIKRRNQLFHPQREIDLWKKILQTACNKK